MGRVHGNVFRPGPGGFQVIHPGREEAVFRFIVRHKAEHDGCAPSRTRIAEAVGINPRRPAMVYYYLEKLARAGLIRYDGSVQDVEVVDGRWVGPQQK